MNHELTIISLAAVITVGTCLAQTDQTLKAGSNTIRLTTTGKGGANFDQIVVVRESPTTVSVTK
ncbi:MAG: hypothetical protein JW709_10925 [Sedimentisphaerales bacterium]|nr:hypothetical protein [Sedimentisphaerales bacterium]